MRLKTSHVFPPIPCRLTDWCAYDEDTYDAELIDGEWISKHPVGYGATEADAIKDFYTLLDEIGT
jgi:hypothetical protein